MAFLRAWLEGVEPRAAWQRYVAGFDDGVDARTVEARRVALLEELLAAGRRAALARPELGLERAVQALSSGATPQPAAVVPTLQEWMDAAGLDPDFYSEAELIEEYRQSHGIDAVAEDAPLNVQGGSPERVKALNTLASVVAVRPSPSDPVEAWFVPKLARSLSKCAHTLEELAIFVCRRGPRWHGAVPGLGARRASSLVAWLREAHASLGAVLDGAAGASCASFQAPSPPLSPVPLERLAAAGPHASDLDAVKEWLAEQAVGGAGWRSYRREAERLLLWCLLARNRTFAQLTREDGLGYERFLAEPPGTWIESRPVERRDAAWRPFRGPLGEASRSQAFAVLRVLWRRLAARGLVRAGIFDDGAARRPALRRHDATAAVAAEVARLPAGPRRARLEALVQACTGGRLPRELPAAALVPIRPPPPRANARGLQELPRPPAASVVSRAGCVRAWRRFLRTLERRAMAHPMSRDAVSGPNALDVRENGNRLTDSASA